MLRLRPAQSLGYSFSEFGSDLYSVVKYPFNIAKDVVTLNYCDIILRSLPGDTATNLVKTIGCNPAGAAAFQAGVIAETGQPAVAGISNALLQACLCSRYGSQFGYNIAQPNIPYPGGYNPYGPPQPVLQPATSPILWIGLAAAVAGVVVLSSKNKKAAAAKAAPAPKPPKDEDEDEED